MHRPNLTATLAAIIAALLLALVPLSAQPEVDARPNEREAPRDTISRTHYSDMIDILSAGVELVGSAGGGDFFDEYAKLGGEQSGLGGYTALVLSGRLALFDRLRVTATAGYQKTGFTEDYDVRRGEGPRAPAIAGVSEDFSIVAVPLIAGIEFAPIRTQFTSYVGVGAGVALTQAKWQTTVQYASERYVRPQSNTESFAVGPVGRVYAGVDLRFDRGSITKAAFRGIYFEAAYTFLPVARDYFAELRARGDGIEEEPARDDATLYLGGLSFTFGLNLQVLRRQ
jgi:hypothetical protein